MPNMGAVKAVVYHASYGCDTGCCGHIVELDGGGEFFFDHPGNEGGLAFAQDMVRRKFGDEHVADLDWENCLVVDD